MFFINLSYTSKDCEPRGNCSVLLAEAEDMAFALAAWWGTFTGVDCFPLLNAHLHRKRL